MMSTRKEIHEYVMVDRKRYGMRRLNFLGCFFGDESCVIKKYLRQFRYLEYYTNKKKYI